MRRSTATALPAVTLGVVLAAGLAGCGGTDSAAPGSPVAQSKAGRASGSASPTPVGSVVDRPQQGFSLTLPRGWEEVSLEPARLRRLLAAARAQDPQSAAVLGRQIDSVVREGGVLFAVRTAARGTNLTVLKLPAEGASAEQVAKTATRELSRLGAREVRTSRVTVAETAAAKATFRLSVQASPQSSIDLRQTQYYVAVGDSVLVLTFVSTEATSEGEFDAIAASLRLR